LGKLVFLSENKGFGSFAIVDLWVMNRPQGGIFYRTASRASLYRRGAMWRAWH